LQICQCHSSLGSIKTILRRNGVTPPEDRVYSVTGTWQKFVANVDSLVACDFLTKKVYSLFGSFDAYVLVFIHLGSRRVWMSPATLSPHDEWCRRQAIQACMWIEDEGIPFRHLIRDNDSKFTDRSIQYSMSYPTRINRSCALAFACHA
jgi:putative transposase